MALLDTLEGWTVHVPGHPDEAEHAIRAAAAAAGREHIRLSVQASAQPLAERPGALTVPRTGAAGTVIAVGPLADPVLAATSGLDLTVLYAAAIRPFDAAGLRARLTAFLG